MKKAGRVLLTVCLALMITLTAAAASEKLEELEEAFEHEYKSAGFDLPKAQELTETKGLIIPQCFGALDDDHNMYLLMFYYEAMPNEEAKRLLLSTEEISEEDSNALQKGLGMVGGVLVLGGDADLDTANAMREKSPILMLLDLEKAQEVGSADDFTYYFVPSANSEAYCSSIDEEYADEFRTIGTALVDALKDAQFYEPSDYAKQMVGTKIEFVTKDLDGNTVTSEELFSNNKITMINCWGMWCPNCLNEMEELARIHTAMQEKGCGIVGLEWEETPDEATYQAAREMMKEWGTNYPNAVMPDELDEQVDGYPTSIFVDSDGNVLCMPVVGAKVSKYESILDALLADEEGTVEMEEEAVATYHVNVTDEDGPVEEVAIQFCSDTSCRFGETDGDGVAAFEAPDGYEYEVEVLEVPDGYEEDSTVYHTTEGSNEVNIQLKKK